MSDPLTEQRVRQVVRATLSAAILTDGPTSTMDEINTIADRVAKELVGTLPPVVGFAPDPAGVEALRRLVFRKSKLGVTAEGRPIPYSEVEPIGTLAIDFLTYYDTREPAADARATERELAALRAIAGTLFSRLAATVQRLALHEPIADLELGTARIRAELEKLGVA